ncbi:3-oxoacyl-ACP reductase FabG [Verrucomicrobia bacterium]|jgi:NAD(P)-dependent dehydrogenase (short-subunit alcohol dehydrogenase family)|nr:3-oxoacyl-ACP reductase FabG [bacterium]MDA7657897.1 3-oxoacyl-ACP reductase FabG [Verrucomicrobiota bacterium]MDA7680150.1 3-oxoacyl-ACP reductase FabG [bacterium]MDB4796747.1 3-oxoacyl-ACP reductase FabG [bacterium]
MSTDIFRLDGKIAMITGGTKGLGLAMAHALASVGAHVAINSRHGAEAEGAAAEIATKHGCRAVGVEADVTKPDQINGFVQRVIDELGSVDILITNAGVNVRLPTTELPLEEWQRVIDINLTGPFLCSQAVIPHMLKKGWGRVIHVSSIMGLVGLAGRPPYTASKGGIVLLTKTQALELAEKGVTVNAICPGPFGTEMNKPLLEDPEKYQAFVSKIPMGRWGEMNELDGAVIFLASQTSSFMTGTTLTVDGGWTAQ